MVVSISAQLGLFAIWLLTANILLGLLLGVQYNPFKRWPHKRINYFTFHNWTGYIALVLSFAHAVLLPFSPTAGWSWADVWWPVHAPQQPLMNVLGALSLYLLAVVVVTSYVRRKMGRKVWKAVHYSSYACAILFIVHGAFLDPKLTNQPINFIDPEKLSIVICAAVTLWATWARTRVALRKRAAHKAKSLAHWDDPSPVEWAAEEG